MCCRILQKQNPIGICINSLQEGGDFIPKDEKGNVLFSDVDFVETWKVQIGALLFIKKIRNETLPTWYHIPVVCCLWNEHSWKSFLQVMEDCVDEGLVKYIGLSNFNSEQIKRVLDVARIKPVVNQVCFCLIWCQQEFSIYINYFKKCQVFASFRALFSRLNATFIYLKKNSLNIAIPMAS